VLPWFRGKALRSGSSLSSDGAGPEMSTGCEEPPGRDADLTQLSLNKRESLATFTVAVVGCGRLGAVAAELLARIGVGRLRLVADELVEAGHSRVLSAAKRLRPDYPAVCVEPVVSRLTRENGDELLGDAHLVIDGSDDDAVRHAINQICVRHTIPWIFAAVSGSSGLMMNIVPGETPCFACIFGNPDSQASNPGRKGESELLLPITTVVAALQVGQAIRLLLGDDGYTKDLLYVDVWKPLLKKTALVKRPRGMGACSVCGWY
jgi:molybdopterin/thiamine biosynthesis adenylyltransferase